MVNSRLYYLRKQRIDPFVFIQIERIGVEWKGKDWRGQDWIGEDWIGMERRGKDNEE